AHMVAGWINITKKRTLNQRCVRPVAYRPRQHRGASTRRVLLKYAALVPNVLDDCDPKRFDPFKVDPPSGTCWPENPFASGFPFGYQVVEYTPDRTVEAHFIRLACST